MIVQIGKHGFGVKIVTSHEHEDIYIYIYINVYRECSPRFPSVDQHYGGAEVDGINTNNYISSIGVIAPLVEMKCSFFYL